MNEHGLKEATDRLFREHFRGMWYMKVHGSPWQRVGVPDYLICANGLFGALELKSPDDPEPPGPKQVEQLRLIHNAGGATAVLHDRDAVKEFLRNLRDCPDTQQLRVGW